MRFFTASICAFALLVSACRGEPAVCTYSSSELAIPKAEELGACKKGDALKIFVKDSARLGREAFWLADDMARLCDVSKPTQIIGPVAEGNTESGSMIGLCTYRGSILDNRRPD